MTVALPDWMFFLTIEYEEHVIRSKFVTKNGLVIYASFIAKRILLIPKLRVP